MRRVVRSKAYVRLRFVKIHILGKFNNIFKIAVEITIDFGIITTINRLVCFCKEARTNRGRETSL